MTAVMERTRVVMPGDPISQPPYLYREDEWAEMDAVKREAEEPDLCEWCPDEPPHPVRWQVYPRPGEFPAPGVLDELVRACACCTFGPRGLYERAKREAADDVDVRIEHLERDGRWVRWEPEF